MSTGQRYPQVVMSVPLGLALLIMVGITGCDTKPAPTKVAPTDNRQANALDLLETALSMLEPDRLDIKGDRTATLAILNDWLSTSIKQEVATIPVSQLKPLVSAETLEQLQLKRFVIHDCDHVRTALMLKPLAERIQSGANGDLERVVRLFQFVIRSIALDQQQDVEMPHTPFHTLVYGRGSGQDRAWVFAEMLRQVQIDCLFLEPQKSDAEGIPYGLVAVPVDGKLYLFDPWLGSPIPKADDEGQTVLIDVPATLSDVLDAPDLLRALDIADGPKYPLTAQQLSSAKPMVIASNSHWAQRNKQLQYSLTGDRTLLIYDGLFDEEDGSEGVLTRLAAATQDRWKAEDFGIWDYIGQQVAILQNPTEQQLQRVNRIEGCLGAPRPISISKAPGSENEVSYGQPSRKLLKARLAQLAGDYQSGLKNYQSVRLALNRLPPNLPLTPEFRREQSLANEYAVFWIADTQLDQQLNRKAAGGLTADGALNDYLRRFPFGLWRNAAALRAGLSLASQGRWKRAVAMLARIESDAPQFRSARMLQKRWQRKTTSPTN